VIVKLRVENQSKCCAKVDIYPDEDAWKKGRHADRTQIFLMNVSIIKRTNSSTHLYAFYVDGESPLCLAGRNESETQDWMRVLRAIFMPKKKVSYEDSK
jgi:hypothetical protein